MRIEYDKDADSVYIYFKDIKEGEVVQTISLNDSVNIDLDADGKTSGIEILDASKNLPANAIKSASIID
jgi:uncharacterized protein YuzE